MKPQFEIADIFRKYGDEYRQNHAMNGDQRKVMVAIMSCRTAQLGGHQEICDQCGHLWNCYNSCRNRHCPKCQTMAKEKWLEKRREELLACLFTAVRNTVFTFAADPQWRLEGKPGLLTILHTWSQTLIDHFHIHCLIPAGVLSMDGKRWVASKDNFLFHVIPLAKEFKKRYLGLITSHLDSLTLPEDNSHFLQEAWNKDWIVYSKKPFSGPEQVLTYLGRYTHRIAIANHRIMAIDGNRVIFSYKDRSDNNRTKTMALQATEFIRRFLLHVLPHRFMKIRYFGFLANNCKVKAILLIRRLIGKAMKVFAFAEETIRENMPRLTGNDVLLCPHCRQGTMTFHAQLYADSS